MDMERGMKRSICGAYGRRGTPLLGSFRRGSGLQNRRGIGSWFVVPHLK